MSVELLVQATTHRKADKGWVEVIKPGPAVWGNKEGLPNWVRFVINDLNVVDVQSLTEVWKSEITWTKISDQPVGRERYRLSMPNNTVVQDPEKGINNSLDSYLKEIYNASRVSREIDQSSAEYDLLFTSLKEMQDDILDKFEDTVVRRRFTFAVSDVDAAIAAGGVLTVPKGRDVLDRAVDGQA